MSGSASASAGLRRLEEGRGNSRAGRDGLRVDAAGLCPARLARSPRHGRPATPICAQSEAALPTVTYRDIFRDPRLQALIEQALVNNRDLMVAAANIAAAREQVRIQRANQFPQVDAGAHRLRHWQRFGCVRAATRPGFSLPSFRDRPVRAAAVADGCPAQPLFRDRGGSADDAAGARVRHRDRMARPMPRTAACCALPRIRSPAPKKA